MKFLIHETLRTLNTDDVFEFGLTETTKSLEYDDSYEAEAVFRRNNRERKHKVPGLSEFDVVRRFMTYIGINLRAIAKNDSIEFDLDGLTLDEYIPLTKTIRDIFDE
ncbi:hypothetical protein [Mesorhizobium sp.]|uniref:hypothetical protein n=1 Tax=Mesorhizobium sp. TaxID=1871066 RepID=UPI000FE5E811|nr:hypothetical protein [Mesorhizobium sp.]RWA60055.1 MAG: hypothetical protein EOQ29_33365 [Mesorhizobium sp.]RWA81386.1 MAG: hypothetical protein EOQ30_19665 [Mesorhizobium sp.]